MSDELFERLIAAFGAGLGLFLAGCASFYFAKRHPRLRGLVGIGAALSGVSLIAMFVPVQIVLVTAGIAVSAIVFLGAFTSQWLSFAPRSCFQFIRRPLGQSVVLAALGATTMLGALTQLTDAEEAATNRDMAWLAEAASIRTPDLEIVEPSPATTDQGTYLAVRRPVEPRDSEELDEIEKRAFPQDFAGRHLIRVSPCDDASNCHGWIFTGGEYWVAGEDVATILTQNHYEAVSDPHAGDLVVYRGGSTIVHTAIVFSALPNEPIVVVGKWGWMSVFRHAVDDSCFGNNYTFYRSPRNGHLLAGLSATNQIERSTVAPE